MGLYINIPFSSLAKEQVLILIFNENGAAVATLFAEGAVAVVSVLWLSAVTIVCSCLCYFLVLWLLRDALVREGVEKIFARIGRK